MPLRRSGIAGEELDVSDEQLLDARPAIRGASSSQYADGASWSLVMPIVQAALTCTVFALAISRGTGAVSLGEALLIALAGAGVVSWRSPRSRSSPPHASSPPTQSESA
jgi:hypothetical protein